MDAHLRKGHKIMDYGDKIIFMEGITKEIMKCCRKKVREIERFLYFHDYNDTFYCRISHSYNGGAYLIGDMMIYDGILIFIL